MTPADEPTDLASASTATAGPSSPMQPRPSAGPRVDLPETLRYRLKNRLLGPPLVNERLGDERLGRPSALGVLAPDCISSSAYGTEQMLTQLIPAVGIAGFALVLPVTYVILGVLFFVTMSYLDVIGFYTKAGGAYVVARDNFGPKVAQVAAVALLIDYTVTVAVQTAAGTAAMTSAFPSLTYWTVPITLGVIALLLYGNLRGIKEAGRFFAFPTYFYIFSLGFVVVAGIVQEVAGTLHPHSVDHPGVIPFGHPSSGLLYGASFVVFLRAFANGGSSLTGLEAISNGVASFREPASTHARQTLVVMSCTLGFLVLGVSLIANWTHAVPYMAGTPTVVSQEVQYVLGTAGFGKVLFYVIQLATMLILYTGGNTSFNGFPFLASYVATDSYLPRQLTRRGHRLAFSNGIIVLTVVAVILIVSTGANLTNLVALYAIGVFTGFAMAGAGMVKHHLDHREGRWKLGVAISAISAVMTASVVAIFATVKFTEGAWVVVIVGPVMFLGLIRLHQRYMVEEAQLEEGAADLAEAPLVRRHEVLVLVDRLDMATARALQYARTLRPDELRAVHFALDPNDTGALEWEWRRLGLAIPLDVRECEDRRLGRAALELAAEEVGDERTELSILLTRRTSGSGWQRVLHDNPADQIAGAVGRLPNVTATVVPYELVGGWFSRRRDRARLRGMLHDIEDGVAPVAVDRVAAERAEADRRVFGAQAAGATPIGDAQWRTRVKIAGRLRSIRVQPRGGTSNLECILADDSGQLLVVFQGRKHIPGVQVGARMVVEGTVGDWSRRPAILNPHYELVAGPDADG